MAIRQIMIVPTLLTRPEPVPEGQEKAIRIGGPHCVRECGQTVRRAAARTAEEKPWRQLCYSRARARCRAGQGYVYAALKGSVPCHPTAQADAGATKDKGLKAAAERVCCSPAALKERMAYLESLGMNTPPPEGFAIWKVLPSKYDPDATDGARGGQLFETLPSPPMMAIDPVCRVRVEPQAEQIRADSATHALDPLHLSATHAFGPVSAQDCNCWVAQDKAESVMKISGRDSQTEQLKLPFPCEDCKLNIAGPAIAVAPDGGVWVSLLGANGGLVRICPKTNKRTLYEVPRPAWLHSMRFIHMVFHEVVEPWFFMQMVVDKTWSGGGVAPLESRICAYPKAECLFAICSNLVNDEGCNAVVALEINKWTSVGNMRAIPLPTQDCCCHRIEKICPGDDKQHHSIVISELSSSKIFQIMIGNVIDGTGTPSAARTRDGQTSAYSATHAARSAPCRDSPR